MSTKRWLDDASDAGDWERAVLRSGLAADPPPGAERAIWRELVAALPPIPPAGLPSPASPAATSASAGLKGAATAVTLAKGFALGVGVSLVVAGADHLTASTAREPTGVATPASSTPPTGAIVTEAPRKQPAPSSAPATMLEPQPAPGPGVPSKALPPAVPALAPVPELPVTEAAPSGVAAFPLSARTQLEQEAALLRQARSELQRGNPSAALATVERSRQRFSAPELAQEREALAIEILHASGQRAAASARAREFLARHPESPHAARIRSFLR